MSTQVYVIVSFFNTEAASIYELNQLHERLMKPIDRSMSAHGISFTEFTILHQLAEAPDNTLKRIDLADSVGLTASGVTRLLAPMNKIGLVEKEENPRDARVSLVKLSKAGRTIYQEASVTFGYKAAAILEPLTEIQLGKLMKYVRKL